MEERKTILEEFRSLKQQELVFSERLEKRLHLEKEKRKHCQRKKINHKEDLEIQNTACNIADAKFD